VAVIRSYSRHIDGSDAGYQGTITAFSESSSLLARLYPFSQNGKAV
jgi:hypothetical protein